MLPVNWTVVPKKSVASQLQAVTACIRNATEIVIATDPDREGEMIAREVLERCKWRGPTKRLWLQSSDPDSVRTAVSELRDGSATEPLYWAAQARSRADWLVGLNMTRALTIAARGKDTYSKRLLSIGRVQTPTLRLIVDRDLAIANFKPVNYWTVVAKLNCADGAQFDAKWKPGAGVVNEAGLCVDEAAARAVAKTVPGASATIASAHTERKYENPPLPHSLSSLTQEASRRFGLSAKAVLDAAQALYETHKLATYPRTDCKHLPNSQHGDASAIVKNCQRIVPVVSATMEDLDIGRKSAAWDDGKVGASAHSAIIPTAYSGGSLDALSDIERKVFTLIAQRYVAQFLPAYEFDQTEIVVSISDEYFHAGGRIERIGGWKVLYQAQSKDSGDDDDTPANDDQALRQRLPALQSGQVVIGDSACIDARKTNPPKHFTDGTLIAAMESVDRFVEDPRLKAILREKEKAGIGTDATRPDIIETLVQRRYVERAKKYVVSTPMARVLISILPTPLTDPATTALWEHALEEIAAGRGDVNGFIQKQGQLLTALVQWVRERAPEIEAKLPPPTPTTPALTRRKKSYATKPASSRTNSVNGSNAAGASCPTCSKGQLVKRTLEKGANPGKEFLGCTHFPNCKHFQWFRA
jgi:DNA topoisomerase-3